ncbi:MAG: DUF2784 domain-containing protein [Spirochaetota bacterium]|jgi:hypothetical protein|nr:DUF2784 domain-containing protein [Spirochaetota bacterium]
MNSPGLTADIVVFVHLLYLLFTVGGEALILTGGILKWRWIRNLPFRITHLVAVVLVSAEALIGMLCPLTELEYTLRRAAGQTVEEEISLVGRIIRSILFYDFPAWFFTGLYVGFGILVILTLFLFPPAWKKRG